MEGETEAGDETARGDVPGRNVSVDAFESKSGGVAEKEASSGAAVALASKGRSDPVADLACGRRLGHEPEAARADQSSGGADDGEGEDLAGGALLGGLLNPVGS